jgi:hypothetical protein
VPQFHRFPRPRRAPRRRLGPRGALAVLGLIAGAAAPLAAGVPLAGPASAASAASAAGVGCPARSGLSCSPKTLTPSLPNTSSTTFQIRQLVQCGSLMYAVGTFSEIVSPNTSGHGSVTYRRNNVFSFSATRPYRVTRWNPDVNGEVNSIAVGGTNCSTAYLGGSFSKVHGRTVRNIAAVSTSSGAVLTKFRSDANNTVQTLVLHDSRLLTGGYFTSINGQDRRYLAGLSPSTGAPDSYLGLDISGNYQYAQTTPVAAPVDPNGTRVYNMQLSHAGGRMLVEGDFTSVGGQSRQQIFMLTLGKTRATVTGWTSPAFSEHCYISEPFYIRAAAWSPGDNTVYTVSTGYHPNNGPTGATPRSGLCDSAARFPASETTVNPSWISYTGCDSLYSVAAGRDNVYVGGHERWADNPDDCDARGPGASAAPGMAGLSETTGRLTFDPTRSRGLGADDMLLTRAGLWIASDNMSGTETVNGKTERYTSDMCGGVGNRAGICFLAS